MSEQAVARLVAHPEPGKVWVQIPHRNDIGSDWIAVDELTTVPPTQPPAAPEGDVRLTEAERKALNRAQFLTPPTLEDNPVHAAVEHILRERLRVVEGEGDAVVEVGAYAQQKEATARAVNDATRMAQVAARRTRELAAMTARAESAEAAHRALQAAVEALADEYAEYGAQREAAGRPAWPNNVARDLRALLAGGGAR